MTPRVRAHPLPLLVPIVDGGRMLCHGRSAESRLAPGTTLAVEGSNTATNDHEMAMGTGLRHAVS